MTEKAATPVLCVLCGYWRATHGAFCEACALSMGGE